VPAAAGADEAGFAAATTDCVRKKHALWTDSKKPASRVSYDSLLISVTNNFPSQIQ
jgi:hypothetical protein